MHAPTARDALDVLQNTTTPAAAAAVAVTAAAEAATPARRWRVARLKKRRDAAAFTTALKGSSGGVDPELEQLLMATHYSNLFNKCQAEGGRDMAELATKISITLLRYNSVIPSDKVFYQVGGLGFFSSSVALAHSLTHIRMHARHTHAHKRAHSGGYGLQGAEPDEPRVRVAEPICRPDGGDRRG